jgi:hypothetical protein
MRANFTVLPWSTKGGAVTRKPAILSVSEERCSQMYLLSASLITRQRSIETKMAYFSIAAAPPVTGASNGFANGSSGFCVMTRCYMFAQRFVRY